MAIENIFDEDKNRYFNVAPELSTLLFGVFVKISIFGIYYFFNEFYENLKSNRLQFCSLLYS